MVWRSFTTLFGLHPDILGHSLIDQRGIMKLIRLLSTTICSLGLVLSTLPAANAAPIARDSFGPNAVNYNFDGTQFGVTTATDGFMTVSNGVVLNVPNAITTSYFDGGDASPIRMDFASPISALGLDFFSNFADTGLGLFDAGNNLLSWLILSTNQLSGCSIPSTNISGLCGFIGVDFGSNSVAYALIDTPLQGSELLIDNIIYQTTEVSEPTTFALMGLGLLGLFLSRRKSTSQTSLLAA